MDRFEELKKYKELLDQDIITQEEFDAKKKELLDSSNKIAGNSLDKMLTSASSKIKEIKDKDEVKAVASSISEKISSSETLNTIQGKVKETPSNKKKIIAIAAVAVLLIVLLFACGGHSGSSSSSSSGSSGGSSYNSSSGSDTSLTDATIKSLVADALYDQVSEQYSTADPGSCKYSINKQDNDGEFIHVYGEVTLYDKYGKLTTGHADKSGTAFRSFEVVIAASQGKVSTCKIK